MPIPRAGLFILPARRGDGAQRPDDKTGPSAGRSHGKSEQSPMRRRHDPFLKLLYRAGARDELLRRLPPDGRAVGTAARERASADRQRVERHGRRRGDGRLVSGVPRVEGGHERDDAHPLERASRAGFSGQLRLPWVRQHRHGGVPWGRPSQSRMVRRVWCGWRRWPMMGRQAGSSAIGAPLRFDPALAQLC